VKSSTQDNAEGTWHKVKGKVKEIAGKVTRNPTLEAKGRVEGKTGKLQGMIGRIKKNGREVTTDARE
jgi:uncharacterized protein YjbJ (UPF0337 family)